VDKAADRIARSRRWQVMPYPVSQREWNVYGGVAGHQRNARMLDAEQPDLVLALIWNRSRGATGCADNALGRGIPVVRIDQELALIPRASAML
jgi:ABC-type Fe3+-hydroxamate transport system substrate-binding protein